MIISSKYTSRCKKCNALTQPGDQVGWKPGEKGVWCLNCTPNNVRAQPHPQQATTSYVTTENGGYTSTDKRSPGVAAAASAVQERVLHKVVMPGNTTFLKAMSLLEDALIERASHPSFKLTDDIERQWARYSKLKAVAMQPGSDQEGRQALKMAIVEVVKLVLG